MRQKTKFHLNHLRSILSCPETYQDTVENASMRHKRNRTRFKKMSLRST